MIWLLALGGWAAACCLIGRLQKLIDRSYVSKSWRVDQQRRADGRGIEQSCIRVWPIQKEDR